jgi:hypothetical protein
MNENTEKMLYAIYKYQEESLQLQRKSTEKLDLISHWVVFWSVLSLIGITIYVLIFLFAFF